MSASDVARILAAQKVQYALVAGIAVAARGHSRFTRDVDFLTTSSIVLQQSIWRELESSARVEIRRGDSDDPLRGVVRIKFVSGESVDVIVAKDQWQQDLIARAERIDIADMTVPVPHTSDLILLKCARRMIYSMQNANGCGKSAESLYSTR